MPMLDRGNVPIPRPIAGRVSLSLSFPSGTSLFLAAFAFFLLFSINRRPSFFLDYRSFKAGRGPNPDQARLDAQLESYRAAKAAAESSSAGGAGAAAAAPAAPAGAMDA